MSRPASHRLPLAALAAGCAIALGACGGGGDSSSSASSSSTASVPAPPRPKQPLSAEIKPWNAALAAKSCEREAPFMFSIIRGAPPGSPAKSSECANGLAPGPPPGNVHFTQAAEYGTGGLMEGPAGGNPPLTGFAAWALDGDGRYHYTGVYGQNTHHEIGTDPRPGNDGQATADAFVSAVRDGDCAALKKTLSAGGRLVKGVDGACKVVLGGAFFAPAVKKSPDAKPVQLGLTQDFGFYGVAAGGDYFTIVMDDDRTRPRLTVLDVLPATPVKLPPQG